LRQLQSELQRLRPLPTAEGREEASGSP
jgi:hypothetical protein